MIMTNTVPDSRQRVLYRFLGVTVAVATSSCLDTVADPGVEFVRGKWLARGARAYNEGLGRSPQRGPGADPLVGGQG